ncbi:hypothetical protein J7K52_05400 [Candidatus Bathyarchaeota archaeon]|nr:hypothetical protein [Candidatus Bathyarchaeota archaeon]
MQRLFNALPLTQNLQGPNTRVREEKYICNRQRLIELRIHTVVIANQV